MKLDQRFSIVASSLSAAHVLQTPGAFAKHDRDTIRFKNAALSTHVELNTGAWHWQKWLGDAGLHVTGLTPTWKDPDVSHCWRFVRRCDLRQYVSSAVEDLLVVPQEFAGDSPNSRDCVL